MTFTIKIRTLPGAPMLCEYDCPDCGRFERIIERDANGDPPASVLCGRTKEVPLMDRRKKIGSLIGDCVLEAVLVIGTTGRGSIKFWSRDPVAIGRASKSDEKDPRALDTTPLAEGKMTKAEWHKWQRGISQERRYQKRLKAGKISKRVQVGGGR